MSVSGHFCLCGPVQWRGGGGRGRRYDFPNLVSQAPYVSNPAVTGATELNQTVLDADLALSALIMWPDASSAVRVVVLELAVNSANNSGIVVWSEPYNGATALPVGTVVRLSPSYAATGACRRGQTPASRLAGVASGRRRRPGLRTIAMATAEKPR
jgi:hypothetical protein